VDLFSVLVQVGNLVFFVIVVCALFSLRFRSWVSVGVLVCFCCSFVVFDRLGDFLLVGILLTMGS